MNEASGRAVGPRCPTCGLAIAWAENLARPFCSLGCELIDLGGWLDATRRVPGPPLGLPDSPVPAATRHHA